MGRIDISFTRRTVIAALSIVAAFAILSGRIFVYQTYGYEKYREKVINQMTTESPTVTKRGEIYDARGRVLATNITTYRVYISPSGISSAQKALDKRASNSISELISRGLSEILEIDYGFVLKKTQKKGRLDETIVKNIDEEKAIEIRKFIVENRLENLLFLEAIYKRYYPYGTLGSHVLGFTSADGVGLYGIEYQYNGEISGEGGHYLTARDSGGNELPNKYNTYFALGDGYNITTTVDAYIQAVLEEQIENAVYDSGALNRACGIVVDVETGGILALSVYPEFDLNNPWDLVEYYEDKLGKSGFAEGSPEYKELVKAYLLETWSNKALTETYIPGSTFKIITSSMALEEKLPIIDREIFCGGVKTVLGKEIHCHQRKGHGSLTFSEGVQHSCNVWFMSIGEKLGVDKFMTYYKLFGYREKTGIDLPGEGMGVISPKMSELDLEIYSFGQNFTVTAIQHISAISAVANGGELLTPYLVEKIEDSDKNLIYEHKTEVKRRVMSEESARKISGILAEGVAGVGGAKNAYVPGYRVAAKTGTSEKKGETTTGEEMYICSCVGYAPSDNPKVAVIIMVDEPTKGLLYGSTVAAPYIGKTLEAILPYMDIEPIYTAEEKNTLDKKIENYVGLPISSALAYAKSRGLEVTVVGDGKTVISQNPNQGEVYSFSGKITFVTDNSLGEVKKIPNVLGKTLSDAETILFENGFNIKLNGAFHDKTAVVAKQIPSAYESSAKGTIVVLEMRSEDAD